MSTYGVAGNSPFGPFTKPIHQIVKEKLDSAWAINNPAKEADQSDAETQDETKLHFDLEWTPGDIKKTYEIRCVRGPDRPSDVDPPSEGMKVEFFHAFIDVHVFVRRNDNKEPIQLHNMVEEVRRIVRQNQSSFGQGIDKVDVIDSIPAHDPTNYGASAYWHIRMVLRCKYTMHNTI